MTTNLLIVEDGTEYLDFFRLFLKGEHSYLHAQSGGGALKLLSKEDVDLVVMDMRFERIPLADLLGDLGQVADEYFGGDIERGQRFVQDNQGTLILAALRENGRDQPCLFVHDMAPKKLQNLRNLYGAVFSVPNFDAAAIRKELKEAMKEK